jgi:hypothetical protein
MKQVRNTLGRLVQSLVGKSRKATPTQHAQPPQELDSRVVAQVSGGAADSVQTPRVGW